MRDLANKIRLNDKWRKANKAKINERYKQIRIECIQAYGGKCECCGEDRHEFLAFDHIEGDGRAHRKKAGNNLAYWLKRHGFPPGIRILCHNCNCALGFYGYCPHQRKED